jgi:phospholipid/cholesterol/gamma-HCH transport system substrate-binding protein
LLYGSEGTEAIRNIRDTFGQLNSILTEVREGDGAVNQLIYGELGDSFMTNLQNASEDIAFLTKETREGKGTIGALLTDPSVYEDIKRLIGDLQRNDILRALVRYSIRRDEPRELTEVNEQ